MSVLIVGAGPSGARLAIQLARGGAEVTLVDRLSDSHRHAYSSGALPLEAVRRLGLPDDAIAATWQGTTRVGMAMGISQAIHQGHLSTRPRKLNRQTGTRRSRANDQNGHRSLSFRPAGP